MPEFIAGNKLFISLRMYKFWDRKLPKADNRKLDYFFRNPLIQTDTTVFKLPEGYTIEALPKEKNWAVRTPPTAPNTGSMNRKGQCIQRQKLVLQRHRIPAADYAAVKKILRRYYVGWGATDSGEKT